VVFKPSELTPLTAEKTVEIWLAAGLPAGVLALLQGGRETGQALATCSQIDGLLFTGSAHTGYQLHRQFAGQPEKMLALEMGGNNALIVEDPADLDAAVNITVQSAFITAGQRCTCARRLLVKRGDAGDAFLQRLTEVAGRLQPAAWNAEPQPFMGSVISTGAAEKIIGEWQRRVDAGGEVLLAMRWPDRHSAILTPGIIDLTGVQGIPDEEVFGPLLGVIRYDTLIGAVLSDNFAGKAKEINLAAAEMGVMVLIAGANVVRFAPALNISEQEVKLGMARFAEVCERLVRGSAS